MTRPINIAGLSPRIATGTGGATLWQAQAELGYRLPFDAAGPVGVTPFGRFEAAALSQNALTEAGALSLNLDVAAQQATSLRSVLGMEVNGRVGSEQPLDLRLRLGWAHEYAPLERPVAASFAGAPGSWFTVYGAQPTRDSATVAFDAALALDARTAVGLHYDGAFASQAADHVLKASLRFIW